LILNVQPRRPLGRIRAHGREKSRRDVTSRVQGKLRRAASLRDGADCWKRLAVEHRTAGIPDLSGNLVLNQLLEIVSTNAYPRQRSGAPGRVEIIVARRETPFRPGQTGQFRFDFLSQNRHEMPQANAYSAAEADVLRSINCMCDPDCPDECQHGRLIALESRYCG
jgi:hypothetical protein